MASTRDSPAVNTSLSRLACLICKDSKRKCDRQLPQCAACLRKDVTCVYAKHRKPRSRRHAPASPSSSPSSVLQTSEHTESVTAPLSYINESFNHNNTASRQWRSVAYFLDGSLFDSMQVQVVPHVSSPDRYHNILRLLGTEQDIRAISLQYFKTVHQWLPIIRRTRFYGSFMGPISELGPDTVLLICAMRLITALPGASDLGPPQLELYNLTKGLIYEAESQRVYTLQFLQAKILVSYYEFGHGVYPAAYLSAGSCARHGTAIGLHQSLKPQTGPHIPISSEEIEDHRRTWWAILILDRSLLLGRPDRPVITMEPVLADYLPMDDMQWDSGLYDLSKTPTLGSGLTTISGRFARLCQGAYLLGRVLQATSNREVDDTLRWEEADQLHRTLKALIHLSDTESCARDIELCTQTAICYSSLFVLEKHMSTSNRANLNNARSMAEDPPEEVNLRDTLPQIQMIITSWLRIYKDRLPYLAPFSLHMVYQAAVIGINSSDENNEKNNEDHLELTKHALHAANLRWKVAASYLKLLDAREVISHYHQSAFDSSETRKQL